MKTKRQQQRLRARHRQLERHMLVHSAGCVMCTFKFEPEDVDYLIGSGVRVPRSLRGLFDARARA